MDHHYGLQARQSDNQHLHLTVYICFCDPHYIVCPEYAGYLLLWSCYRASHIHLRLLAAEMIENQISRGWKRCPRY